MMHLSRVEIKGFKGFKDFQLPLTSGLNVLIGENAVGKTGIIDAIRLLLLEDEYGRNGIAESHFYKSFGENATPSESFRIRAVFSDLDEEERVAFLPWTEGSDTATLTLHADNQENRRGRYKRTLWGGASRNSVFEWELLDTINCIYLPPLRDAEAKLREGRGSRLARLLKNLNRQALKKAKESRIPHELENKVNAFNKDLAKEGPIADAQGLIRDRLKDSLGSVFGQDALIQSPKQILTALWKACVSSFTQRWIRIWIRTFSETLDKTVLVTTTSSIWQRFLLN
ncbi:AAA domain-containing protein [Candidatus Electrothrix aarhusensis]|uniref:AAA domain-containing protein n=1 Tax=Candidatus Electrothrix aarhusensis TaxID=1859131 RepID=A0A3S3SKC5_9BACT|nr:AAA domain-containing protein [Candidatus Electrothrix aarhusensis]